MTDIIVDKCASKESPPVWLISASIILPLLLLATGLAEFATCWACPISTYLYNVVLWFTIAIWIILLIYPFAMEDYY